MNGKSAVIGHNRSKTIGDSKYQNAHPFGFSNIVGVHNGTLPWTCRDRLEHDGGHKFETDSQSLYSHINANGIENSIKLMEGAWSLVWFDKRNQTINFLRNKERPMVYCFDDEQKRLFWASEVAMLYLALNRRGVEFGNQKDSKPFYLPEDMLMSWKLPDWGQEFSKPVRQKMEAPKSFPSSYSMTTNRTTASDTTHGCFSDARAKLEERKRSLTPGTSCSIGDSRTVPFTGSTHTVRADLEAKGVLRMSCLVHGQPPYYFGSSHTVVFDKDQFETIMLNGCIVCADVPVWGEPVKFLKDHTFICASCLLTNKENVHETASMLL